MTTEAKEDDGLAVVEMEARLRAAGWPWPLAKAAIDPFDYAICLRDSTVLRFTHVTEQEPSEFVTLHSDSDAGIQVWQNGKWTPFVFNTERGLVVRVADIVWAIDAPEGS